ncbi:hypothetical protein FE257_009763 [Aspergillus nanangensis]|uniref:Apc15p protein-domain-containing protein n=1 Tax=Aspergillus nanangensis TaxID=2582783 RepID=A0AAD4CJI5_ASPNN|nr:hypothetical protein FE257_009763 [Aspergillus nanangensis]
MLSLPLITPRDSHELWFGSSQPYRSSSQSQPGHDATGHPRRHGNGNSLHGRAYGTPAAPTNTLSTLLLEERALRVRKSNIASFGYSWIKPAGCSKTMLGMREEDAERKEALAAANAEMVAAAAAAADPQFGEGDEEGQDDTGMERDLDDDIPDADAEGLVEEGEEGLEEDGAVDEEGYMERDLDDDIPEALPDDEYEDEDEIDEEDEEDALADENFDDFDNQPDLDADIPSAGEGYDSPEGMDRDLDDEIPEADHEEEWQHTDTDEEFDDEEDEVSFSRDDPFAQSLRASTNSTRGLPAPPPLRRERGTEAQRRFLQRWSGGGDAFDSSSMVVDEDDLRASVASQTSRQPTFGRFPRRRTGGPRDSFG